MGLGSHDDYNFAPRLYIDAAPEGDRLSAPSSITPLDWTEDSIRFTCKGYLIYQACPKSDYRPQMHSLICY